MIEHYRLMAAARSLAALLVGADDENQVLAITLDALRGALPGQTLAVCSSGPLGDSRAASGDFDDQAPGAVSFPFGSSRGGNGCIALRSDRQVSILTISFIENIALIVSANLARIEAVKQLAAAVRDRELLHRELRHRSRNSLQLILNMVPLLLSPLSGLNPSARDDVEKRINALIALYALLDRADAAGRVRVAEYFSNLVTMLRSLTLEDQGLISAGIDVDGKREISQERATGIALILHELVINSIKHAGRRRVAMNFSLHLDRDRLVLGYSDAPAPERSAADEQPAFYGSAQPPAPANADGGIGIIEALLARAGGERRRTDAPLHSFEARFPL
jgi:two-component sensor histidine kinase